MRRVIQILRLALLMLFCGTFIAFCAADAVGHLLLLYDHRAISPDQLMVVTCPLAALVGLLTEFLIRGEPLLDPAVLASNLAWIGPTARRVLRTFRLAFLTIICGEIIGVFAATTLVVRTSGYDHLGGGETATWMLITVPIGVALGVLIELSIRHQSRHRAARRAARSAGLNEPRA